MPSEITLKTCAARLLASDNILILTHNRPDGDTLGSAAGLCVALRDCGKTAYVLKNTDTSAKLLPFVEKHFAPDGFAPAFVVAVDIASEGLFPDPAKQYCGRVDLCIDHHGSNEHYAAEYHVEPEAAACAEIISELLPLLGAARTVEAATPLYLGLATDTGCFRYSSVTAHTHRVAAELLEAGIDHYAINRDFFEVKSRAAMAVETAILSTASYYRDGSVAVGTLTLDTLATAGATDDDTANISSVLRTIEGVELGVLIRENEDGSWRVSARSVPGINASDICAHLGGGGHTAAAGATLRTGRDEAYAAVLDAIRAELGEL